jgi:hypothetical protein
VSKGYAEGPAAEEAERRREELAKGAVTAAPEQRQAVYGSTAERPDRHSIGWLDEVEPEALFASGEAWGITIMRRRAGA